MPMHADELPVSAGLVRELAGAWNLLAKEPRGVLREGLGCTDLGWERGKTWAFEQAMGLVWG